jgi:hypothetical protein
MASSKPRVKLSRLIYNKIIFGNSFSFVAIHLKSLGLTDGSTKALIVLMVMIFFDVSLAF